MSLASWLQARWFPAPPGRLAWSLLPLLPMWALFALLATCRRWAYRLGLCRVFRLPVPVVVVGNITVGGAGKTPLTLAIVQALRQAGWRPGIVSRGYGADAQGVWAVSMLDDPRLVGDEPLLMARRSGVPVWVGRARAVAGAALLAAHPEVDVLVCDDGLQHLAMARDVELAVFDARGAGNGWLLPMGPLRESLARLASVDAVVYNGGVPPEGDGAPPGTPCFGMQLRAQAFYALHDPALRCSAADLAGKTLHAIAGIGHPERFFGTLAALGLHFQAHAFADHHAYVAEDLRFGPDAVLLMTEKDAVKCAGLAEGSAWVLPVEAEVDSALIDLIVEKLRGRKAA